MPFLSVVCNVSGPESETDVQTAAPAEDTLTLPVVIGIESAASFADEEDNSISRAEIGYHNCLLTEWMDRLGYSANINCICFAQRLRWHIMWKGCSFAFGMVC